MTYHNPKPARCVSLIVRQSAKGEDCDLLLDGCRNDTETTVHCHIRQKGFNGVNMKPLDIFGYHGCSECHRREAEAGYDDLLRAMMETQDRLYQAGIIEVMK